MELAARADKMLSADNYLMRTVLPLVLARSNRLAGNMEEAVAQLGKLAGLARAAGNVMTLASAAEKSGRNGRLIEILISQALAFKALDEEAPALNALDKALRLAEPEGYCRSFIDAGTAMMPP